MKQYKPYDKYKDSEIVWLDKVPEHWEETALRKLFIDNKNKNTELSEKNLLTLSYGKIKNKDINTASGLLPASFAGYQVMDQGDIVMRLLDLQNDKNSLRVGYVKEKGIITSAYIGLKPKSDIHSKYYFELLNYVDLIKHFYNGGGGVRQSMGFNELGKERLVFPPLPEQTAIANFLDYKTRKIDRFVRKKKQLIKLLNEQKAAIINHVVTRGINPDAPLRPSGIDWLGDIPAHWEVRKLKYLVDKTGSGITPRGGSEIYRKDGIPFLRSQNVHFDGLKLDNVVYIDKAVHDSMLNTELKPNDVVLNITGASIGRCCIIPYTLGIGNVNQHVCIIRPKTIIISEYLAKTLSSSYIQRLIQFEQVGASREGLNQFEIRNMPILHSPLPEQQAIVEYIERETAQLDKTIAAIEQEIALVQEYRTALIAEAVTGKIDVRHYAVPATDASDECEEDEIYTELDDMVDSDTEQVNEE
ncbi:restriction endonuclease subunit S [Dysgonomonas sp. ZJ279]|uniref:restriction endonuclease subunit S n=1 Tax=Dysgonomonas sp. ZJ279 TaxID=2709796 RepID=UPI0013EB1C3A|nr:restriction endonuclease subunit S [Dysgonomonas sp. ZJ279]